MCAAEQLLVCADWQALQQCPLPCRCQQQPHYRSTTWRWAMQAAAAAGCARTYKLLRRSGQKHIHKAAAQPPLLLLCLC